MEVGQMVHEGESRGVLKPGCLIRLFIFLVYYSLDLP
jgi:hypothetical protein